MQKHVITKHIKKRIPKRPPKQLQHTWKLEDVARIRGKASEYLQQITNK